MDENGNLYASNEQTWGQFHHSSFLAGVRSPARVNCRCPTAKFSSSPTTAATTGRRAP